MNEMTVFATVGMIGLALIMMVFGVIWGLQTFMTHGENRGDQHEA